MPHSPDFTMWLLVALVIVIWPIFFACLWSATVFLISLLGGWRRLSKRYATAEHPHGGRMIRHVTGMVGMSRYRRLLTVTVNTEGMFLQVRWIFRMGHRTLFIPWSDIYKAHTRRFHFGDFIAFEIGQPKLASMRLPPSVFDGSPVFID